jgi:hypothetical protein
MYHDEIFLKYINHRFVDKKVFLINVDYIDEMNYYVEDNHSKNYLTIDQVLMMMMLKIDDNSMYEVNPYNLMMLMMMKQDPNNDYLN